jgi:hypothetical protein
MSEVNLNFELSPVEANLLITTNDITFTPTALNLALYTGGLGVPGGSPSTLQYNAGGILGGINNVTSTGNAISFANVGNIKISGGVTGQALITDGAGNLSFGTIVGGSNTQVQYNNNGNLGGMPLVTYSSGNLTLGPIGNVKITGGSSGQSITTDGAGNLSYTTIVGGSNTQLQYNNNGVLAGMTNVNFISGNLSLGPVSNVQIGGGTNGYILQTDGLGNLTWVAGAGGNGAVGGSNSQVQFNRAGVFGGIAGFTLDTVSNIVSITTSALATTTVSSLLTVTGTSAIQQAKEKTVISASVPASTTNFDLLDGAINYYTGNMNANITLNVRGNSTTSFDSLTSTGDSVTIAMVTSSGTTAYVISALQIDGASVTPKWVSNTAPLAGLLQTSGINAYTYTIIKTAAASFTVLGSYIGYK